MSNLILIRGLPGAGKTTLAKEFVKLGYLHFEADQHFEKSGKYKFDSSKIKEAHSICISNTESFLAENRDVVVANTFTRIFEMQKYFDLAEKYKTNLYIVKATGKYKSLHNVPEETLKKMAERWQEL